MMANNNNAKVTRGARDLPREFELSPLDIELNRVAIDTHSLCSRERKKYARIQVIQDVNYYL